MTSETVLARRFFEMSLLVITSELSRISQERVWNLTPTQHSALFSCSPSVGYDGADFNCWAKHFNSNQFSQIGKHLLADSCNGCSLLGSRTWNKGKKSLLPRDTWKRPKGDAEVAIWQERMCGFPTASSHDGASLRNTKSAQTQGPHWAKLLSYHGQ